MGKVIFMKNRMGEVDMATIFDVANYFIMKCKDQDENPMTPLKLQKLCYYAQAWSMVWDGKQLFNEDFQAWVHGPANYKLYKKYNGISINSFIDEVDEDFNEGIFRDEQKETLEAVWDGYGKFSGSYLEQLSHQEEPWKVARGTLAPGMPSNRVISKVCIKEFYLKEYGQE